MKNRYNAYLAVVIAGASLVVAAGVLAFGIYINLQEGLQPPPTHYFLTFLEFGLGIFLSGYGALRTRNPKTGSGGIGWSLAGAALLVGAALVYTFSSIFSGASGIDAPTLVSCGVPILVGISMFLQAIGYLGMDGKIK